MGNVNEWHTSFQQALEKKREWLSYTRIPELKEKFSGFRTTFSTLYFTLLRKNAIVKDPYKSEVAASDLKMPETSALFEPKKREAFSLRLARYDNQLEYITAFCDFSVDTFTPDKIKILQATIWFIEWKTLSLTSPSPNTQAMAEIFLNLRNRAANKTMWGNLEAIIQVDKTGQNSIVLYGGGNAALKKDEVGPIISAFGPGDMILLQNEIPLTAELMKAASARGMKVCLNPSPFDGRIAALPLDLADLLFVNEIEAAGLAGRSVSEDPAAILEALALRFPRAELVLTAGKEGAYYAHKGLRAKGDIVDLPVADTTGAGDTFTGFYLAARQRGCDVAESLRLACKASSIAVSRKGAMASMPFAREVF